MATSNQTFQQFEPGYTVPRPLFRYGGIPMNFRGNWEIPTRELHAPPFIPMFTTDREYLDSDFEEEYPLPSPRSVMCCRIVAIIVRLPPSLPPSPFVGRTLSGRPLLSTRRLFRRLAWQRVRQIKDLNEPIEIKISEWNTGGLLARIEGLRAFLPKAELMNRVNNFKELKENNSLAFRTENRMKSWEVYTGRRGFQNKILFVSFWPPVWKTTYLKRISRHVIIFLFPFGLFNTLLLNFTVHHGPQILQTSASSSRLTFSSKARALPALSSEPSTPALIGSQEVCLLLKICCLWPK
ncbi:hypothetical protein NC651_010153 [Populus alba x Populus x berolinensis]|nr:hypothetical protein NC651_010153 [Populus alba x Populus x berolinensis]